MPSWALALVFSAGALGTSQLAISLVNWVVTLMAMPHVLPRMNYAKGIAPESRTLVVVPTMLTSERRINDLIEALEVRFLANQDPNLHFGLLTDFCDAAVEHLPQDAALQQQAAAGIAALNTKYNSTNGETFFLFHRPRRWNDACLLYTSRCV